MVGNLIVQNITQLALSLGLNINIETIFTSTFIGHLVKLQIDNFTIFGKKVLAITDKQKLEIKNDVIIELTKEGSLLTKKIIESVFDELEEEKLQFYARIFYESI